MPDFIVFGTDMFPKYMFVTSYFFQTKLGKKIVYFRKRYPLLLDYT